MINFASLFNQFRAGSNSPINDLIEQPDTDLDRLLDEDSFLNEYKSANAKVMAYMKYDKMQTLVQYVTVVGPSQDKKKGYKFPLAACDILSSDNSSTVEFFLPGTQLYLEETVEEEVEVEEEQQIDEETPKDDEQTEMTPQTMVDEPNEDQNKQEEVPNDKNDSSEEQKMDTEEPVEVKKKTQLVKRQKIVNKVIKKEVEPLMDELFNYFDQEVNYTLAGYISKILISFFNKKPVPTMKYILEEANFDRMLNHIESRSVGQFITKIMTHESTELLPEREAALKKMLAKLSINHEIYVISNLSQCVCEIVEKVATNAKSTTPIAQYCSIFFDPEILMTVINNVTSQNENVSVYNSPILFTYLTNAPMALPEDESIINKFKTILSSFVERSIEKLKVTKDERENLGFGRVKIVQILSFILRENTLNAREIVARHSQFFPTFYHLLKNYQMNNILHNEFVKIVTVALSEDAQSPLLNNLVDDDCLLNFLKEESEEDMKIRAGSGKQKNRKGYIGHVISICRKIQENAGENQKLNILCEKPEFQNIVSELVNKEMFECNKNLAGFSLKRNANQNIMFMKEEVIKEHIKFLAMAPMPVYVPQNINNEGEDGQKLDVNEILEETDQREEKVKEIEEVLGEDVSPAVSPAYWTVHMEYSVDDLMNEL